MALVTKVVDYGGKSEAESGVQIFLDPVANLDAEGKEKTNFYPGDTIYVLVIVPAGTRLLSVESTLEYGGRRWPVLRIGRVVRPEKEQKLFTLNGQKEALGKIPFGGVSVVWYGRDGELSVTGGAVSAARVPSLGEVKYSYQAEQYAMATPAELEVTEEKPFYIGIVVYVDSRDLAGSLR